MKIPHSFAIRATIVALVVLSLIAVGIVAYTPKKGHPAPSSQTTITQLSEVSFNTTYTSGVPAQKTLSEFKVGPCEHLGLTISVKNEKVLIMNYDGKVIMDGVTLRIVNNNHTLIGVSRTDSTKFFTLTRYIPSDVDFSPENELMIFQVGSALELTAPMVILSTQSCLELKKLLHVE